MCPFHLVLFYLCLTEWWVFYFRLAEQLYVVFELVNGSAKDCYVYN
jgi:hypothetical protein